MKVLYWNVRGLANNETRLVLKKLCQVNKPDVVLLSELWMEFCNFPSSFWNSIGLKEFAFNDRGSRSPNLWCLCAPSLDPVLISVTDQLCVFSVKVNNQVCYMVVVHASTSYLIRRDLWRDLAMFERSFPGAWSFFGDFNAMSGSHEKRGGGLPL